MFDLALAGFLVSVPIGMVSRMSNIFTLGFCMGGVVIGIMDRGLCGYARLMWDLETLAVFGGGAVGYSLGYLAADRVALWLENR